MVFIVLDKQRITCNILILCLGQSSIERCPNGTQHIPSNSQTYIIVYFEAVAQQYYYCTCTILIFMYCSHNLAMTLVLARTCTCTCTA